MLLFLTLIITSCKDKIIPLYGVETNPHSVPKEITKIINDCINCGCYWRFHDTKKYNKIIRYSKSYFSPDSTKFFIIVTTQYDGLQNQSNPDALFSISGDAFIGYKENNQWYVYYYLANMPYGYYSYVEVEDGLIEYFEGEEFRNNHWINKFKNSVKSQGSIGFSPNQNGFWESELWQKNVEILNRYPFEISRLYDETTVVGSINELLIDCN